MLDRSAFLEITTLGMTERLYCNPKTGERARENSEGQLILVKSSEQWYNSYMHLTMQDPTGWDRANFRFSWYIELITREEFERRLNLSTVSFGSRHVQALAD